MAGINKAGSNRFPMISTIQDLQLLAELMYRGGCTPPGVDNPNKVFVVILTGLEIGLSPTQAIGSIMLVGGKPTVYGDGLLAIVKSSGLLESIDEQVIGEEDDRHAVCKVKRKGEAERVYTFSMRDANRAGLIARANGKGPWVTYPDRMLIARARGFAMRDIFPDVLRGLVSYEEAIDIQQSLTEAPPSIEQSGNTTTSTQPALPQHNEPSANSLSPQMVTTDQLRQIADLKKLAIPASLSPEEAAEKWTSILSGYNVKSARELTHESAEEFITRLSNKTIPF